MSDIVLVVGSYPPVRSASAGAALDAVRRTWADGDEAVVASPRVTAAHRVAPVTGVLAGLHLWALQRQVRADRLVLAAEPGLPVERGAGSLRSWATCAGLGRALAGFGSVTVVECGFGPADPPGWALVRRAATTVVAAPEAEGDDGASPVLLGADRAEQRRLAARSLARRALGRHAPRLRRLAGAGRRAAQATRSRIRPARSP